MVVRFEDYKGNKLIVLYNNEKDAFPVRLYKSKCRLIVQHIEEIKKFVEEK